MEREPDISSSASEIVITDFESWHADAFRELNYEWLEEFFEVEPYDRIVLGNPQKHIIDQGGAILVALDKVDPVGVCALLKHSDTKFELAKLGVTKSHQGQGVGRMLLEASITKARELDASTLILATSKLLVPANRLYEKFGFREVPLEEIGPLPYHRKTIAMALKL